MVEIGIKNKISKIVEIKDTASVYGSGLLEVFATPAMIAFMEQVCHLAVKPYLDKGFDTVGTEVCIQHLKATPVGDTVSAECVVSEVDGRKIVFEVSASDSKGLIGKGTHTRFIIDSEKFMSKLK